MIAGSPSAFGPRPAVRPSDTDVIRVVLADDHLIVRAGLKALLRSAKDIEVVGEAANGPDAVAVIQRLSPRVAVLDLDMPRMDALTVTKQLQDECRCTRVLILTMQTEDLRLASALHAGAAGYLAKSLADRELAEAVRAVAAGCVYLPPPASLAFARAMSMRREHAEERERFERLTERERSVLLLVAGGFSASEIGEQLFVSARTVESYKHRIAEKLCLRHRADYVQLCLKLGLLQARAPAPPAGRRSGKP